MSVGEGTGLSLSCSRWQYAASAPSARCSASVIVAPVALQPGRSGNKAQKRASGSLLMKAMKGRIPISVPSIKGANAANACATQLIDGSIAI